MSFRINTLAAAIGLIALQAAPALAREPLTMWFWGASPAYQDVLNKSLKVPFEAAQDKYELDIEFRNGAAPNAQIAALAGQGPDLIFQNGPADVTRIATAGKLASMDGYAKKYGWADRIVEPAMLSCTVDGHLYCLPIAMVAEGMFYNKKVLAANGWELPKTGADIEKIMTAAQALGMYGSATGNKGYQPVNENYSSLFINQYLGPANLYNTLTGKMDFNSPQMLAAMTNLNRWFKAGYLGGKDYFSLDFDTSLKLLSEGKTPFFFAPIFAYQWAINHFTGDAANDVGWTAFPQMDPSVPYPSFSIGDGATYSINGNSPQDHQDAAAQVIDLMMTPEFATSMAKVWPGYWAVPIKNFPDDPTATGVVKSFYDSEKQLADAMSSGHFGYKVQTFFPPATMDVLIKDVENMWLDKMTPQQVVDKAKVAFDKERARGLVGGIPKNSYVQ